MLLAAIPWESDIPVFVAAKWTSVLEPRYVLAVARLADRAGDRETAEFARFLELWKVADEGLPELIEAQRYLKGFASNGS